MHCCWRGIKSILSGRIRFLAKLYCLLSNMAGVDRIMSFADRDEPEKHLGRPAAVVGGG